MDFLWSKELWSAAAAILITVLLWLAVKKITKIYMQKDDISGKKTTNISFIATIIKYILLVMLLITILEIYGVNVSSLIAGLGIAGIIIGFALQDILKDLIMGTSLVVDNFFSVGDVVKYKNIKGKIIYFNIKVTKIQSIDTGAICTVCNRNISEIEKLPDYFYLSVPMSYEISAQKSRDILKQICKKAAETSLIKKCEFLGTDEFCESLINYKLCVHCDASKAYSARRAVLGIVQDVYTENNISVPYNKLDVKLL